MLPKVVFLILILSTPAYAITANATAYVCDPPVTMSQNDDGSITTPPDVTCTATGNTVECDY